MNFFMSNSWQRFLGGLHSQDEKECGRCYFDVGVQRAQEGNWSEALCCYNHALKIQRTVSGQDHFACARTLYKISVAQVNMGNHYMAKVSIEEALYILQRNFDDDNAEVTEIKGYLQYVNDLTTIESNERREIILNKGAYCGTKRVVEKSIAWRVGQTEKCNAFSTENDPSSTAEVSYEKRKIAVLNANDQFKKVQQEICRTGAITNAGGQHAAINLMKKMLTEHREKEEKERRNDEMEKDLLMASMSDIFNRSITSIGKFFHVNSMESERKDTLETVLRSSTARLA